MRVVLLSTAVAVTSAVVAVFATAAPALAGPGQHDACSGAACVSVAAGSAGAVYPAGSDVDEIFNLSVRGADVAAATVQTHQDPTLAAHAGTLTVDGAPAPAGSVTSTGGDLTVDLAAAGADLTQGADITIGFTATLAATAIGSATSWVSVTFDNGSDAPATANSDDLVIDVQRPDLSLAASPAVVARGGSGNGSVSIQNGTAAATPATLTLTFPTHLSLAANGVSDLVADKPLACTAAGATTTCQVTRDMVASFTELDVQIAADDSLPAGTHLSVAARIDPVGVTDGRAADNATTIPVTIIGRAHLAYSVRVPTQHVTVGAAVGHAELPLGTPTKVVLTVTNDGPDPAPHASISYGLFGPPNRDVTITDADGHAFPNHRNVVTAAIGTLAAGASFSVTVLVPGHTLAAQAALGLNGGEEHWYDPQVQCASRACLSASAVSFTVVAPAASTGNGTGTDGSGTTPLANTGTAVRGDLGIGIGAVLAGLLLCAAARRPGRHRSRRVAA